MILGAVAVPKPRILGHGFLKASEAFGSPSKPFEDLQGVEELPKASKSFRRPCTYVRLLNKPYVNEVILRGQNLTLKCCQPLEVLTRFKMGLDL